MKITGTYPDAGQQQKKKLRGAHSVQTEPGDAVLARKSGRGDMQAFEELFRRHYRRVSALCLRMCGRVPEAEDLTQDVFIQLHRKIGSFRAKSAFTTWLHRLTVNIVLMHFRKRSVRYEKTTDEGEMPEQVVLGTDNPARMAVQNRIDIDHAIKQLPRGYSSVFVLYDIEGYEHEEIAKILKVAVGTSKSQLHKARLKLRQILLGKTLKRAVYSASMLVLSFI